MGEIVKRAVKATVKDQSAIVMNLSDRKQLLSERLVGNSFDLREFRLAPRINVGTVLKVKNGNVKEVLVKENVTFNNKTYDVPSIKMFEYSNPYLSMSMSCKMFNSKSTVTYTGDNGEKDIHVYEHGILDFVIDKELCIDSLSKLSLLMTITGDEVDYSEDLALMVVGRVTTYVEPTYNSDGSEKSKGFTVRNNIFCVVGIEDGLNLSRVELTSSAIDAINHLRTLNDLLGDRFVLELHEEFIKAQGL